MDGHHGGGPAGAPAVARSTRAEIPIEETWDPADIYPTEDAWRRDHDAVEALCADVARFQGRLAEGPSTLLECLRAHEALWERAHRVLQYAYLRMEGDSLSAENQARAAKADALHARARAATASVESEMLALADGALEHAPAEEPGLAAYRPRIEAALLQQAHALAPETETALATLSEVLDAPAAIHQRTLAAMDFPPVEDADGRPIPMSVAGYRVLAQSPDRALRRRAYAARTVGFDRYKVPLAATLATHVTRNVALARLRGYGSAAEMLLAPERVPVAVYESVMDAVEAEGAPQVQRLVRLRRRLLGVDRLGYFDLVAPLEGGDPPPLTYQDAGDLLRSAFAPLGAACVGIVDTALRERWIDRADNAGKRPGGGSRPVYGVHPYAFLTWSGALRDAFVLAHELGHVVHFELAARHRNFDNALGSHRFFVEAPPALGELLLGQHLLDTTSGTARRWALGHLVAACAGSLESLLLNGRLERRLYAAAEAGTPLTLEFLMDAQAEVFAGCYGDAVAVDDGARLFWVQAPHLYVGLYPYAYAVGLACAWGVFDAIGREGQPAVERWLRALEAGTSVPPLELARLAGVEMEQAAPVRRAMASFGALVEQLEGAFT